MGDEPRKKQHQNTQANIGFLLNYKLGSYVYGSLQYFFTKH